MMSVQENLRQLISFVLEVRLLLLLLLKILLWVITGLGLVLPTLAEACWA